MQNTSELSKPEIIDAPTMVIYNKKLLTVEEWLDEIRPPTTGASQETPPTRPPSLDHTTAQKSNQEPPSFWRSLARVFRKDGPRRDVVKAEDKRIEN